MNKCTDYAAVFYAKKKIKSFGNGPCRGEG